MLSNNYMEIKNQSKFSGAAVVQVSKTGLSNQLWIPVSVGVGQWKIKSVHAPDLYLSILNNEIDDGSKIIVTNGTTSSQVWKI